MYTIEPIIPPIIIPRMVFGIRYITTIIAAVDITTFDMSISGGRTPDILANSIDVSNINDNVPSVVANAAPAIPYLGVSMKLNTMLIIEPITNAYIGNCGFPSP